MLKSLELLFFRTKKVAYIYEKSALVWNQTQDLLYYRHVHSPPINFAFWQVGGLANIPQTNYYLTPM